MRATLNARPFLRRLGFHVLPRHYDDPVPDLSARGAEVWTRQSGLFGVDMRAEQQQARLVALAARFRDEYGAFPAKATPDPYRFHFGNPSFGPVDAEMLYCMLRHYRPKRVLEVGSGHSTLLAAQALQVNQAEGAPPAELVAIEPFPNAALRSGIPGVGRLIELPVQEVPIREFLRLGADDVLFIDSSHMLKTGSDVQVLYLDVLPRLAPGVIIHVHDVFFPCEYPRRWAADFGWYWNEQYLLQAFLAFNETFEVLWASNFMHTRHPDCLTDAFISYGADVSPASFWMRRVG